MLCGIVCVNTAFVVLSIHHQSVIFQSGDFRFAGSRNAICHNQHGGAAHRLCSCAHSPAPVRSRTGSAIANASECFRRHAFFWATRRHSGLSQFWLEPRPIRLCCSLLQHPPTARCLSGPLGVWIPAPVRAYNTSRFTIHPLIVHQ